jgi:hypothetical protein
MSFILNTNWRRLRVSAPNITRRTTNLTGFGEAYCGLGVCSVWNVGGKMRMKCLTRRLEQKLHKTIPRCLSYNFLAWIMKDVVAVNAGKILVETHRLCE